MIDPSNITNYNLSRPKLQEMILFWVCAAGKNGKTAARCLDRLLKKWRPSAQGGTPFEIVRHIFSQKGGSLADEMRACGIGCQVSKARTFSELAWSGLDLKTCSLDDLTAIHGIGPKTARCFLIHSRPNQPYAGLDTHLLKFLRAMGHDVPASTPTGKKYLKLEEVFLDYVRQSGLTVAELDLLIWNVYSGNGGDKDYLFSLLDTRVAV